MDFLGTTLFQLLSKVTGGKILIDSYMKDDLSLIIEVLESYGVKEEEVSALFNEMNNVEISNEAFSNAQNLITSMYVKKLDTDLKNGIITTDCISDELDDFNSLVIHSRSELISISNNKELWDKNINWNPDYLNMAKRNLSSQTYQMADEKVII